MGFAHGEMAEKDGANWGSVVCSQQGVEEHICAWDVQVSTGFEHCALQLRAPPVQKDQTGGVACQLLEAFEIGIAEAIRSHRIHVGDHGALPHCLLPTATAHCPLPTAHCPLPSLHQLRHTSMEVCRVQDHD